MLSFSTTEEQCWCGSERQSFLKRADKGWKSCVTVKRNNLLLKEHDMQPPDFQSVFLSKSPLPTG